MATECYVLTGNVTNMVQTTYFQQTITKLRKVAIIHWRKKSIYHEKQFEVSFTWTTAN